MNLDTLKDKGEPMNYKSLFEEDRATLYDIQHKLELDQHICQETLYNYLIDTQEKYLKALQCYDPTILSKLEDDNKDMTETIGLLQNDILYLKKGIEISENKTSHNNDIKILMEGESRHYLELQEEVKELKDRLATSKNDENNRIIKYTNKIESLEAQKSTPDDAKEIKSLKKQIRYKDRINEILSLTVSYFVSKKGKRYEP